MIAAVVIICLLLVFFTVFTGAPYVPSKRRDIMKAFDEVYRLRPSDVVLDLGSGDGVVLRIAALRGAGRALGYEISPLLVLVSRVLHRKYKNTQTKLANIWTTPFPEDVTLVYLFGDTRDLKRLEKRLLAEATRLDRTLSVLSYGFQFSFAAKADNGLHYLYEFVPLQKKKA